MPEQTKPRCQHFRPEIAEYPHNSGTILIKIGKYAKLWSLTLLLNLTLTSCKLHDHLYTVSIQNRAENPVDTKTIKKIDHDFSGTNGIKFSSGHYPNAAPDSVLKGNDSNRKVYDASGPSQYSAIIRFLCGDDLTIVAPITTAELSADEFTHAVTPTLPPDWNPPTCPTPTPTPTATPTPNADLPLTLTIDLSANAQTLRDRATSYKIGVFPATAISEIQAAMTEGTGLNLTASQPMTSTTLSASLADNAQVLVVVRAYDLCQRVLSQTISKNSTVAGLRQMQTATITVPVTLSDLGPGPCPTPTPSAGTGGSGGTPGAPSSGSAGTSATLNRGVHTPAEATF